MRKRLIGTWCQIMTVAGAYVGAVVGGGFATGREIIHFFMPGGQMGLWGIIVAVIGFVGGGALLMSVVCRYRLDSAGQIGHLLFSDPWLIKLLDWIFILFYMAIMAVVMSASGSLAGTFNLEQVYGVVPMTVLTGFALMADQRTNTIINIVLMMSLVCILAAVLAPLDILASNRISSSDISLSSFSPVIYVSYNLIFALAIFPRLGVQDRPKTAVIGAIFGGLFLGIMCFSQIRTMSEVHKHVTGADVPLGVTVSLIQPRLVNLYPVVVGCSLLTTAIAVGRALLSRICIRMETRQKLVWPLLILSAATSGAGLSQMVAAVYPVMGWMSFILWVYLIFTAKNSCKC